MAKALEGKKTSIRRRILSLMLGSSLVSFLALGAVSLHGMYGIQRNAEENVRQVGEAVAAYVEDYAATKTTRQMMMLADKKAHQVESEMVLALENADHLADAVGHILENQELYIPRPISSPDERRIAKGEPYLLLSPQSSGETIPPEIAREIGLVANAADDMEVLCAIYDGYGVNCYIASEHGYFIGTEPVSVDEAYDRIFTEEFLSGYEPRERVWYRAAREAGQPVLTSRYVGYDGRVEITCAAPYHDRNGFAGAVGMDLHLADLSRMLSDRALGTKNISFGLSGDGEVLFSTEKEGLLSVSEDHRDLREAPEESLAKQAVRMVEGEMDIAPVTMDGQEYYIAYAPMPKIGWSLGMLIRQDEAMQGAWGARDDIQAQSAGFAVSMQGFFWDNLLQIALLMLGVLFLMVRGSERVTARFVEPILALTGGVQDMAKGNLGRKLNVRTGDELENLAGAVNHMTEELKIYADNIAREAAEKKRIATELSLAQNIQEGMLPSIYPKFSGNSHFDMFALMDAAKEVGGDFFDFYYIDEDRLAVTVADVSGKGVPASLFMVISKTVLKNAAQSMGQQEDFGHAMERVNRQLCKDNEEMMFVTVFFGVLNLNTGEFVYVNGGHNPPLLGRRDGAGLNWQYIREEKKSRMVGISENTAYVERRLQLAPGDMLYLYTDGVTEAMDKEWRLYTEARLQEVLGRVGRPETAVKDILLSVRRDIEAHAGGAEQSDDITMLGIRYLG